MCVCFYFITCGRTETATRLSPECCEQLVKSGATNVIFTLIRCCNRSVPCMDVITFSIQILLNLSKVQTWTFCFFRIFCSSVLFLRTLMFSNLKEEHVNLRVKGQLHCDVLFCDVESNLYIFKFKTFKENCFCDFLYQVTVNLRSFITLNKTVFFSNRKKNELQ